jgi:hypothetical protein
MSGGGSTPSDTTTTTRPFPAQEKALTELFGMSQAAFDAGPQQFYPGQTVADQGFNTVAGQQLGLDAAGIQGGLGMQAAQNLSAAFDPNSAQSQAVISSQAIQQGAFGGDRQRIQEQSAAEATSGAATQAILRNQQNAIQNLGSVQSGLLAPARTVSAVGAQQNSYDQALIDADRERFRFQQEAPETALDRLGSRISGINLGQIGNTTSSGGGGGNSAATAAGAGIAAYGLFGGGGGS